MPNTTSSKKIIGPQHRTSHPWSNIKVAKLLRAVEEDLMPKLNIDDASQMKPGTEGKDDLAGLTSLVRMDGIGPALQQMLTH